MKKINLSKIKTWFNLPRASFIMVLILMFVTAYGLFAPITPAKYEKPDVINKNNITAGQPLKYKIYTCRYVSDAVVTTVTRKLVSTTDPQLAPIILSSDTLTNERRCLESTKTLIVPNSTPTGHYKLVIQGIYQVIPLRKPITVTTESDSFYMKKADPNTVQIDNEEQIISLLQMLNDKYSKAIEARTSDNVIQTPQKTVTSNPSTARNSNSSTTQNTTNNNTTNNTTNNNTENNSTTPSTGLIPDLLRNLTGADILPLGLMR